MTFIQVFFGVLFGLLAFVVFLHKIESYLDINLGEPIGETDHEHDNAQTSFPIDGAFREACDRACLILDTPMRIRAINAILSAESTQKIHTIRDGIEVVLEKQERKQS